MMQLRIDFDIEIWKDIKGYEGHYMISSYGNVKSIKPFSKRHIIFKKLDINEKNKFMKLHIDTTGYLFTILSKECKHKTVRINRLVAETFIDKPKESKRVGFKNNNKLDCNVKNLFWMQNKYSTIRIKRKGFQLIKEEIKYRNLFRLKAAINGNIARSLNKTKIKKSIRAEKYLGCSIYFFKTHLESLFEDWMNWDNYGKYNGDFNFGWDIDHKIPISSAKTEEDIIKLNHYSNLRPLCSKVNRYIKRNKLNF